MAKVIIGVDPHKLSATIEVVDDHEKSSDGTVRHRPGRLCRDAHVREVLAGAGLGGRGQQRRRPAAGAAAPRRGEHVVDVPAKLSARARLFDTGHNRKTDALDAHAIAVVAARTPTLRMLIRDGGFLEALRAEFVRGALEGRRNQGAGSHGRYGAELLRACPAPAAGHLCRARCAGLGSEPPPRGIRPSRPWLPVHIAGPTGGVRSGRSVDEQPIVLTSLPEVDKDMERVHPPGGRRDVHVRVVLKHRQREARPTLHQRPLRVRRTGRFPPPWRGCGRLIAAPGIATKKPPVAKATESARG